MAIQQLRKTFSDLPAEIIDLIVRQLAAQGDRKSLLHLACTNKSLTSFCLPHVTSIPFITAKIETVNGDILSLRRELGLNSWDVIRDLEEDKEKRVEDFRRLIIHAGHKSWIDQHIWYIVTKDVIPKISWLDDFSYEQICCTELPSCLFDTIRKYHSHCTFHLNVRILREIRKHLPDHSGFKLVTSPLRSGVGIDYGVGERLESIETLHHRRHAVSSHPSWNDGFSYPWFQRIWFTPSRVQPDSDWIQVRIEEKSISAPRDSLHYLRIGELSSITAAELMTWGDITDLSVLQVLDLDARVEQEALEHWAAHLQLPGLKTLLFPIIPSAGATKDHVLGYCRAVERFLFSLPPLSRIELTGVHSPISIPSLVRHHGQCLRTLIVESSTGPYLTKSDVLEMSKHCPLLEELTLSLRRSQGDAEEVAGYKALGAIRHLKTLNLTLIVSHLTLVDEESMAGVVEPNTNPSNPSNPSSYGESIEDPCYSKCVRRLIINASIDRRLALAIFHAISPPKARGAPPVQELKIQVAPQDTLDSFRPGVKFSRIVERFSSSWLVECDRTFKNHRVLVMEMTKDKGTKDQRTEPLEPWLEDIFYSIWPKHRRQQRKTSKKLKHKRDKERTESTSAWSRHWESFPLAADAEESRGGGRRDSG